MRSKVTFFIAKLNAVQGSKKTDESVEIQSLVLQAYAIRSLIFQAHPEEKMRLKFWFIICIALTVLVESLEAEVPQLISYQGHVTVSGTNFNGLGQFKFALVHGASTNISLWSNDGSSTNGGEPITSVSISVSQGVFNIFMGNVALSNMTSISPTIFTNSNIYLRIWFNDGVQGFSQLSPDQRIASVGYAMVAETVLDGSITSIQLAAGAVTGSKISPNTIDITKLTFIPIISETDPKIIVASNNSLPKWNGSALIDGTIYDNGNIGIGTNNPTAKLDVAGGIAINGASVINALGQWVGSPTGLQGPQGPQGLQGPQGPGAPVCSDTFAGSANTSSPFSLTCLSGSWLLGYECYIISSGIQQPVTVSGNMATCNGIGTRKLRITCCRP